MEEKNINDIIKRISNILNNRRYQKMLNIANNNWLKLPFKYVISSVFNYIDSLILVEA